MIGYVLNNVQQAGDSRGEDGRDQPRGRERSRCGRARSGRWRTEAAALRPAHRPDGDEHPAKRPPGKAGAGSDEVDKHGALSRDQVDFLNKTLR